MEVLEIDGHSYLDTNKAFKNFYAEIKKPTLIIANTTKGNFFYGEFSIWHSKVLDERNYLKAKKELS